MCKMKRKSKFGKLFHAYADEKGLDVLELPFYADGERIGYDDTPETLDLSDYDSIDLILHSNQNIFGAEQSSASIEIQIVKNALQQ